jgi:hypothetical protein
VIEFREVVCGEGRTANGRQTLQLTRQLLDQSNYSQIPQLSSGLDIDLDNMSLVV